MTFYKVKIIGTNLYYDALIHYGNGKFPFSEIGSMYFQLDVAQRIKAQCAKHKHKCEIVMFIQHTIEVGTISKNGKLNVSCNQVVS